MSQVEIILKAKITEMLGKVVLVGTTHLNKRGEVIGHDQFFGTVKRFNYEEGLVISRGDNDMEMALPPTLENYSVAAPGIYSLKASGHKVINPDYLATFNVHENEE
jgi:hypothetical protein